MKINTAIEILIAHNLWRRDNVGDMPEVNITDLGIAFDTIIKHHQEPQKEQVDHPEHYNNQSIEAIEMMRRIWGDETLKAFCEMNAFKYRMRMGLKEVGETAIKDLKKAKWYENKSKELSKNIKIKDDKKTNYCICVAYSDCKRTIL